MSRKIYTAFILLFCVLSTMAQVPVIKWQNAAISDTPKIMELEEDGYKWTETYRVNENLVQLLPLPDGNYMGLVVTYRSTYEFKLVKFNANGDTIFVKRLDDFQVIQHINKSMAAAPDGGFVLLGNDLTSSAISVLKLDENGNKQWMESYRGGDANGGAVNESPGSIIATADGGYLLAISTNRQAGNDKTENSKGGEDYWLIKIDATGLVEWDKTIGGSGRDYWPIVVRANDGGYLIAGNSQSSASGDKSEGQKGGDISPGTGINYNEDFWVVKLTANGSLVWDKTIGGTKTERLTILRITTDGGFLIGGVSESGVGEDKTSANYGEDGSDDMWVVKCNGVGSIQWQQGLGGDGYEELSSTYELADGGYMIGGRSSSGISGTKTVLGYDDGGGNTDYWVIKLNNTGNVAWQTAVGGSGDEWLGAMLPTADGGILLAGSSSSMITGVRTVAQKGYKDFWFVQLGEAPLPVKLVSFTGHKVNGEAMLEWTTAGEENFKQFDLEKTTGLLHFKKVASITAKGNNSHYSYTDTLAEGITYYRLKMIDKDGTAAYSNTVSLKNIASLQVNVYPNPVTGGRSLIVILPPARQNSVLQVAGIDGKIISTQKVPAGATKLQINTRTLAAGSYLLLYSDDKQHISTRFLKQ